MCQLKVHARERGHALAEAKERGYKREHIRAVLLVGGSSLIPSVRRAVRQMFGDRVRYHRPLEAVALGGAAFVGGVDFYRWSLPQMLQTLLAELEAWPGWPHLRQVWLVRQTTEYPDGRLEVEDRFFLTSLLWKCASAKQFLALVRQHWWIENQCFWRLDVDFDEEHPWSTKGWGPLVMGVLLCLAFNILHLLRDRTLRGERPPWESFASFVGLVEKALVYGVGYEAGRRAAVY